MRTPLLLLGCFALFCVVPSAASTRTQDSTVLTERLCHCGSPSGSQAMNVEALIPRRNTLCAIERRQAILHVDQLGSYFYALSAIESLFEVDRVGSPAGRYIGPSQAEADRIASGRYVDGTRLIPRHSSPNGRYIRTITRVSSPIGRYVDHTLLVARIPSPKGRYIASNFTLSSPFGRYVDVPHVIKRISSPIGRYLNDLVRLSSPRGRYVNGTTANEQRASLAAANNEGLRRVNSSTGRYVSGAMSVARITSPQGRYVSAPQTPSVAIGRYFSQSFVIGNVREIEKGLRRRVNRLTDTSTLQNSDPSRNIVRVSPPAGRYVVIKPAVADWQKIFWEPSPSDRYVTEQGFALRQSSPPGRYVDRPTKKKMHPRTSYQLH